MLNHLPSAGYGRGMSAHDPLDDALLEAALGTLFEETPSLTLGDLSEAVRRHPELERVPLLFFIEAYLEDTEEEDTEEETPEQSRVHPPPVMMLGRSPRNPKIQQGMEIIEERLPQAIHPRSLREVFHREDGIPFEVAQRAMQYMLASGKVERLGHARGSRYLWRAASSHKRTHIHTCATKMRRTQRKVLFSYMKNGSVRRTSLETGKAEKTVDKTLLTLRRMFGVPTNQELIFIARQLSVKS